MDLNNVFFVVKNLPEQLKDFAFCSFDKLTSLPKI